MEQEESWMHRGSAVGVAEAVHDRSATFSVQTEVSRGGGGGGLGGPFKLGDSDNDHNAVLVVEFERIRALEARLEEAQGVLAAAILQCEQTTATATPQTVVTSNVGTGSAMSLLTVPSKTNPNNNKPTNATVDQRLDRTTSWSRSCLVLSTTMGGDPGHATVGGGDSASFVTHEDDDSAGFDNSDDRHSVATKAPPPPTPCLPFSEGEAMAASPSLFVEKQQQRPSITDCCAFNSSVVSSPVAHLPSPPTTVQSTFHRGRSGNLNNKSNSECTAAGATTTTAAGSSDDDDVQTGGSNAPTERGLLISVAADASDDVTLLASSDKTLSPLVIMNPPSASTAAAAVVAVASTNNNYNTSNNPVAETLMVVEVEAPSMYVDDKVGGEGSMPLDAAIGQLLQHSKSPQQRIPHHGIPDVNNDVNRSPATTIAPATPPSLPPSLSAQLHKVQQQIRICREALADVMLQSRELLVPMHNSSNLQPHHHQQTFNDNNRNSVGSIGSSLDIKSLASGGGGGRSPRCELIVGQLAKVFSTPRDGPLGLIGGGDSGVSAAAGGGVDLVIGVQTNSSVHLPRTNNNNNNHNLTNSPSLRQSSFCSVPRSPNLPMWSSSKAPSDSPPNYHSNEQIPSTTAHDAGASGSDAGGSLQHHNNKLGTSVTCDSTAQSMVAHVPAPTTTVLEKGKDEFTGNKVINQYLILDDIGQGACGKVKLGFSLERNITVAIKIVRRQIIAVELDGRRASLASPISPRLGRKSLAKEDSLRREIALMKKLRHPNIITLFEVIDDPTVNKLYLVMNFADNGCIAKIAEADHRCTAIPLSAVVDVSFQVASGLQYLHDRDVYHRDIKPENILSNSDGRILISDFGISLAKRKRKLESTTGGSMDTSTPLGIGTPLFMAPELWARRQRDDAEGGGDNNNQQQKHCTSSAFETAVEEDELNYKASDMWALGVTLFALLFGRLPYSANDLKSSSPQCFDTIRLQILEAILEPARTKSCESQECVQSREVWASVVSQLLAEEPSDRPSAADLRRSARALKEAVLCTNCASTICTLPAVVAESAIGSSGKKSSISQAHASSSTVSGAGSRHSTRSSTTKSVHLTDEDLHAAISVRGFSVAMGVSTTNYYNGVSDGTTGDNGPGAVSGSLQPKDLEEVAEMMTTALRSYGARLSEPSPQQQLTWSFVDTTRFMGDAALHVESSTATTPVAQDAPGAAVAA